MGALPGEDTKVQDVEFFKVDENGHDPKPKSEAPISSSKRTVLELLRFLAILSQECMLFVTRLSAFTSLGMRIRRRRPVEHSFTRLV
jgi:hypothetical protein